MSYQPQDKQLKKLSPKRATFVLEYVKDFNGKRAAIAAGYSAKTAEVQASALLRRTAVKLAVELAMKERAERSQITQDWVMERLRIESTRTGPGSQHAARVQALKLCGQHIGMFNENRLKIEGDIGIDHNHAVVNLGALDLPLETLVAIRDAYERSQKPSPVAFKPKPGGPPTILEQQGTASL